MLLKVTVKLRRQLLMFYDKGFRFGIGVLYKLWVSHICRIRKKENISESKWKEMNGYSVTEKIKG